MTLTNLPGSWQPDCMYLLGRNLGHLDHKVNQIKAVREMFGLGLVESKDLVDEWHAGPPSDLDLIQECDDLLAQELARKGVGHG